MRRAVVTVVGLLAAAVVAFYGALSWTLRPAEPQAVRHTVFTVESGWTASQTATALKDQGFIRSAAPFRAYLRLTGADRRIGEGSYPMSPALTGFEVARVLSYGGRPDTVQVTIPEGTTVRGVAALLEDAGIGTYESNLALLLDPGRAAVDWLPQAAVSLEGYLFPDTYTLRADATPEEAAETLMQHFLDVARPLVPQAEALGLTLHQWVTLASLVQQEAGGAAEKPIIAGVFFNRLDEGMRLQSDPTVAYGLEKTLPELSAVAGDLQRDHAWNTYTRHGLPVGPIANPGRVALETVLNPDRYTENGEPWRFFLHGFEDGEKVFRPNVTYEAHLRDVNRFLR
jgi:UPF0755 protein